MKKKKKSELQMYCLSVADTEGVQVVCLNTLSALPYSNVQSGQNNLIKDEGHYKPQLCSSVSKNIFFKLQHVSFLKFIMFENA